MEVVMIFLGIGMMLAALVIWTFAQAEIVRNGRINEMAARFCENHILENLYLKRDILTGKFDLDSWQHEDLLEALNQALDWQRKHSTADEPATPQDGSGI